MRCGAGCCASAGASTANESRNTAAWLRIVGHPINLPVLADRLEILPEFGVVAEPADQIVQAGDGNDRNTVTLFDFLDRRKLPFASLHPVQGDYHSGRRRAARGD